MDKQIPIYPTCSDGQYLNLYYYTSRLNHATFKKFKKPTFFHSINSNINERILINSSNDMVLNDLAYDADSIAGRKRESGCRVKHGHSYQVLTFIIPPKYHLNHLFLSS